MTEKEKEVLRRLGITPGEWSSPHLEEKGCQCGYIFNPGGVAVCKVLFNDGEYKPFDINEEVLPLGEAQANGRLLKASPEMILALIDVYQDVYLNENNRRHLMIENVIESATNKQWSEVRQIWQEVMG